MAQVEKEDEFLSINVNEGNARAHTHNISFSFFTNRRIFIIQPTEYIDVV